LQKNQTDRNWKIVPDKIKFKLILMSVSLRAFILAILVCVFPATFHSRLLAAVRSHWLGTTIAVMGFPMMSRATSPFTEMAIWAPGATGGRPLRVFPTRKINPQNMMMIKH